MLPPSDSDEDEEEKPAKPEPKKEAGQVRINATWCVGCRWEHVHSRDVSVALHTKCPSQMPG